MPLDPGTWPAVVERMRENMRALGRSDPSDLDLEQIIEFLQSNASP